MVVLRGSAGLRSRTLARIPDHLAPQVSHVGLESPAQELKCTKPLKWAATI